MDPLPAAGPSTGRNADSEPDDRLRGVRQPDGQRVIGPDTRLPAVREPAGHAFRIVDHLITNFHLPESTLLMLVCAFAGTERVLAAYRHAVAGGYRFYSYGDAMLLHRV